MRIGVQIPEPTQKTTTARSGVVYLQFQCQGHGEGQISRVCWPVSIAYLESSRTLGDPVPKIQGGWHLINNCQGYPLVFTCMVHAVKHTPTCIPTYIQAHINTYKYTHLYIHTYTHTHTRRHIFIVPVRPFDHFISKISPHLSFSFLRF